jgi:hypothetical protein
VAEPAGLGVLAAGAFGEQVMECLADRGDVCAQAIQIGRVAFGSVQGVEHAPKLARERPSELAGLTVAFAQRDEISGEVSQAHPPAGVVHAELDGVAVGHDHPVGCLAQQRLGSVAIATFGDLKEHHALAV